jgi:glycogen debranching enzyme
LVIYSERQPIFQVKEFNVNSLRMMFIGLTVLSAASTRTVAQVAKDAGTGVHISEIFEGDAPHRPCGCIAQAWSVAEILRVYLEDVRDLRPSCDLVAAEPQSKKRLMDLGLAPQEHLYGRGS